MFSTSSFTIIPLPVLDPSPKPLNSSTNTIITPIIINLTKYLIIIYRPPKAEAKPAAKAAPAKGGPKKGGAKISKKVAIPPGQRRKMRKSRFRKALNVAIENYKSVLVIGIDNVGSNQIQLVRLKLRELGCTMLVGKNTVIRPVIQEAAEAGNKKIARLLPFVKQNVGFVFTNSDDLSSIRDLITKNKIPAAARTGVIAPADVHIPAGPTPLDPGMFLFFTFKHIFSFSSFFFHTCSIFIWWYFINMMIESSKV